ncbi:MAG TPA: Si-specific NAD(P)(+) transhydrogenase [Gammaproteobacteria bacterium]|nr:Si-specific NAD(P)(+) transhydrogenase [Gammaproteobacteria bacterium]
MDKFDFITIGSGPAGQRAAIQAAKLGKNVAVVEKNLAIGGACLHVGTIPSKTLREAVLYLSGWRQRGFYGRSYRVKQRITAEDLMQRLDITIRHEIEVLQHKLGRNGVTTLVGSAQFKDPHVLRVEHVDGSLQEYYGEHILIACGTMPSHPPNISFNGTSIIDSDDIMLMKNLPRSMAIVGAGVIGVEYASIFSALDIEVTLIDGRPLMLDFLDREITDEFIHNLRDRGVNIRLGDKVESIEDLGNGRVRLHLASGKQVRSEMVLFAAGREGATQQLKIESAGLAIDKRGRLTVDEHYRTSVPHIYAAGDVIGFPSLASTSMEQGRHAACHAFGAQLAPPQYGEVFPFGIYAVPEMSVIGKTEEEVVKQGIKHEIGIARFRETSRGQILGLREGLLKLIFAIDDRKLLGAHIVGEGATELIHIGQAVLAHGGTLDYFVNTVFNYPTLAEAYKVAALDAWNNFPA